MLAGLLASGATPGAALGQLQALIGASLGQPHLAIAPAARIWTAAPPLPDTKEI